MEVFFFFFQVGFLQNFFLNLCHYIHFSDTRSKIRGIRSKIRGIRSKIRGIRSKIRGIRSKIRGIRSKIRGTCGLDLIVLIMKFYLGLPLQKERRTLIHKNDVSKTGTEP